MFGILLICLGGFVQANVREDVGDIPYENQGNAVDRDVAGAVRPSTGSDYGDIPYEKAIEKLRDYGNIPYERDVSKPDYGNIPYEKVGATTGSGVDIKGKIMEILGDRVVIPEPKTTGASVYVDLNRTSQPTTQVKKIQSTELITVNVNNVTMKLRADDSGFIDYVPPGTIDDSQCTKTCSTCTESAGYRIYCLNGTTTTAPSDLSLLLDIMVELTKDYEDYSKPQILTKHAFNNSVFVKYPLGWPHCPTTTKTTSTPTPTFAPHNLSGSLIAKCFVCGMFEPGIPMDNTICADSFMSHSYKKHCKFLNRHDWHVNGTNDFYMWGRWTGGCSMRFVDITGENWRDDRGFIGNRFLGKKISLPQKSMVDTPFESKGVYTQRTCRNINEPALGTHYISRRMAKLEEALKHDTDACVSTPEASLVPLSRGISLYSRFTACVCSADYCNSAQRCKALSTWYADAAVIVGALRIFERTLQSQSLLKVRF